MLTRFIAIFLAALLGSQASFAGYVVCLDGGACHVAEAMTVTTASAAGSSCGASCRHGHGGSHGGSHDAPEESETHGIGSATGDTHDCECTDQEIEVGDAVSSRQDGIAPPALTLVIAVSTLQGWMCGSPTPTVAPATSPHHVCPACRADALRTIRLLL